MAALPSITVDTSALEKQHAPSIGSFRDRMLKLEARKLSVVTDELARELGSDCKAFLDALEKQRKELKEPILEAGRKLDSFFATMAAPATEARQIANQKIAAWDQEQRRIAEEKRREDERIAREQAEAEAKARAEALAAEAAQVAEADPQQAESLLEQAAQVEAEPIIPVVVAPPPPPKQEGASVRYKLEGTVTDWILFFRWLTEHPEALKVNNDPAKGIWITKGEIDKVVERRGQTPVPGVTVKKVPIVSNRAR